jgi:hypothetical protein
MSNVFWTRCHAVDTLRRMSRCKGPECHRSAEVGGEFCLSHYQQMRRTGRLRPLRPRSDRERLSGVKLTDSAMKALADVAKKRGLPLSTIAAEVIEAWAKCP